MTSKISKIITQLSSYVGVPAGKITFDGFGVPNRSHNNVTTKGLFNIIVGLLKESNKNELLGKIEIEKALVYQFVEYANVYVVGCNLQQIVSQILPHINGWLSVNTYLTGTKVTIADVLMYYLLHNALAELSHLEQGKFVNVFRWMDNLQQDQRIRQKNSIILFNMNVICSSDTAKCQYVYNVS